MPTACQSSTGLLDGKQQSMSLASKSTPRSMLTPLEGRHTALGRRIVGGLFLWGSGIHIGIAAADPSTYRHFADGGLFGFVRQGWANIFMADARAWALALACAELAAGVLLLTRGRAVATGWAAVIVFHVLLMLFGFGFWLWSLPALAVLCRLAWTDRVEWQRHSDEGGRP